jgi:four helix bundle protein
LPGEEEMKSVKDLDVFKLAHEMALVIYKITKGFPEEEKFGLAAQMRRAAYSVPMNLVEGANRLNSKEYRRFVGIAKGSAAEVGYQLLLARDLNYIDENTYQRSQSNYDRISQMLAKLAKSLK